MLLLGSFPQTCLLSPLYLFIYFIFPPLCSQFLRVLPYSLNVPYVVSYFCLRFSHCVISESLLIVLVIHFRDLSLLSLILSCLFMFKKDLIAGSLCTRSGGDGAPPLAGSALELTGQKSCLFTGAPECLYTDLVLVIYKSLKT